MISISPTTHATLLLMARLDATARSEHQPLDLREWNVLAHWLVERGLRPEHLVHDSPDAILADWEHPRIDRERLMRLLDRGHQVAWSVEHWRSAGIWILGRSDPEYPKQLRDRLLVSAPTLLFGAGESSLLAGEGIAIVGSRDATVDELRFADDLGAAVGKAGYSVISGGARGVDERAAQGAFQTEGRVVAIIAESLVRNASKKLYRNHLANGTLVLATSFSPDVGFRPGNAMARNAHIYGLAQAAIVVSSTNGSGGTFHGASSNLRSKWKVPLWVVRTADCASGNHVLQKHGAQWLPPPEQLSIDQLKNPAWTPPEPVSDPPSTGPAHELESMEVDGKLIPSLYELFLEHWRRMGTEPVTPGEMASTLGIHVKQARTWLDLGVDQGLATKVANPARYQLVD